MRVLAISAHADDETLGCGGTLLKHRQKNDAVSWMIATSPCAPAFSDKFIQQRRAQIEVVSKAYGMVAIHTLGFPAARLDSVPFADIIDKMRSVFLEGYDRIYVVNRGDVHSDHRIVFEAAWALVKPFNTREACEVYAYETMSSTNMAAPYAAAPFTATGYCDVTSFWERKLDILKLYDSELQPTPHPRSVEAVEALARYRGSAIGAPYAEAFMTIRSIL
jgi:LmbE family N-acetylglucosaminyl deacetylase